MQPNLPAFETHRVDNQPPPFEDHDLWSDDMALREAVVRTGAADFAPRLAAYGKLAGGELYRLGFDANRDRPRLRSHDAQGRRIDRVEFHPAYHRLLALAKRHGLAGLPWQQPVRGAHVARAVLSYLHHQAEAGSSCPLTMTHAAGAVLGRDPALRGWADKAAAPHYDRRELPLARKRGVTIGMGMTEKQGGSDLRGTTTTATAQADGDYVLVGHKWFFSAPMSDAFLVLAQAPAGLSCFLLPRLLANGERNGLRLIRLKDKLGDWSNASAEVEFCRARAQRIGAEGQGVATIMQMVMLTRLDCMLAAAAQMRMALAQALQHARLRLAFGRRLIEQALMANVLADLAIESEAATVLALRVAAAVDAAPRDPAEAALARVLTALGKYWLCKRAPTFVAEAMECLGGNGYVEESALPRLYRQAPLNSIWEGSANIQCLDLLRALRREPECVRALSHQLDLTVNDDAGFVEQVRVRLGQPVAEEQARSFGEDLVLALQATLLLRAASPIAAAFVASRLRCRHRMVQGGLNAIDPGPILLRALP